MPLLPRENVSNPLNVINYINIQADYPIHTGSAEGFLLRQASLQYFTASQFFSHFLRQENGRLHAGHILVGRSLFLGLFEDFAGIFTEDLWIQDVDVKIEDHGKTHPANIRYHQPCGHFIDTGKGKNRKQDGDL